MTHDTQTTHQGRGLFIGCLLATLAVAGVALADASYETASYGGNGGSYFEDECIDHFVKGLNVRSARLVDRVGLRCYNSNKTLVEDRNVSFGGDGGNFARTTCRSGYVMKGLRGRSARLVDQVQLTCVKESEVTPTKDPSSESIDYGYPKYGGEGGSYFSVRCNRGDGAVGILGRSGRLVDRIGVICRNVGN